MSIRKYKTKTGKIRYAVNLWDKQLGKTRWVGTFRTSRDAKLALSEADRRMRLGELAVEQKIVGFSDHVKRYLDSLTVEDETKKEYARLLARPEKRFRNKDIRSIGKQDIEEFVAAMIREDLSPRYVRKVITRLSQALNVAVEWGYLSVSPTARRIRNLPKIHEQPFVPLEACEVKALISAAPDYWKPAFLMLVACGLRRGELFGLRIKDVDFETKTVTVRGQLKNGVLQHTKTEAGMRTISLPEQLVVELKGHIKKVPETDDGLLFPTETGSPVTPSNFYRRIWRPTVESSGVRRDLKMHDLRKQFASIAVRQGRSAAYLQSVMGHRSAATTLKWYAGQFSDEADAAARGMNEWLGQEAADVDYAA